MARFAIVAALLVLTVVGWAIVRHKPAPVAATPPAAASPGSVIQDCASCPTLTVLPAGRFKQGSAPSDPGYTPFEGPQHWVILARPIALSTNPVTVDQFARFVEATGRDMRGCETYDGTWKSRPDGSWKNPGFVQAGAHPVTCVSFDDATAYAQWLSVQTGHTYRLPSASEWEYAARAGGAAAQPWGSAAEACANANVADASAAHRYPGLRVFACDDGFVNTSPVGSFKANAFGLNDMLGNVFQWTQDCWNGDYAGAPVDGSAWSSGDCGSRELRGGSWFSAPKFVRATYRNQFAADYRTSTVGIRLVREL
jgi:formylglycine-generating enzyme required for sulfatase activity